VFGEQARQHDVILLLGRGSPVRARSPGRVRPCAWGC
jgi:hypothetical protein